MGSSRAAEPFLVTGCGALSCTPCGTWGLAVALHCCAGPEDVLRCSSGPKTPARRWERQLSVPGAQREASRCSGERGRDREWVRAPPPPCPDFTPFPCSLWERPPREESVGTWGEEGGWFRRKLWAADSGTQARPSPWGARAVLPDLGVVTAGSATGHVTDAPRGDSLF